MKGYVQKGYRKHNYSNDSPRDYEKNTSLATEKERVRTFCEEEQNDKFKFYKRGSKLLNEIDFEKFWTETFVEEMKRCYRRTLLSQSGKPVALSFFNTNEPNSRQDRRDLIDQLVKAKWLSDGRNRKVLQDLCIEVLAQFFPEAIRNYGVSDDYFFNDIPRERFSRKPETFVFAHTDSFLKKMIEAPKIPLTDWLTIESRLDYCIQVRKVALRVGKECMVGEFTKYTNYIGGDTLANEGSGLKFCVYARGVERGKFLVSRWDYEPFGIHFNKFGDKGNFDINGFYCQKTRHSHMHNYNLKQRLFFTQNQSSDVCPTPINQNEERKERVYNNFEDMVDNFEDYYNYLGGRTPRVSRYENVKEYIEENCPIAVIGNRFIYTKEELKRERELQKSADNELVIRAMRKENRQWQNEFGAREMGE